MRVGEADEFQFVLSLLCLLASLLPCFLCFAAALSCDNTRRYLYNTFVHSRRLVPLFTPSSPPISPLLSCTSSTSSLTLDLPRSFFTSLFLLFIVLVLSLFLFSFPSLLSLLSFPYPSFLYLVFVFPPPLSHILHSTTPLPCRINTSSFFPSLTIPIPSYKKVVPGTLTQRRS